MTSIKHLKGKKNTMIKSIQIPETALLRSMTTLDFHTNSQMDLKQYTISNRHKMIVDSQTVDATTPRANNMKGNWDFAFLSPQHAKIKDNIIKEVNMKNDNIMIQNQLLKGQIRLLSSQIYQLQLHKCNKGQSTQKEIGQIYKNLNLKLSIKNTLVSQIRKIIIDFQADSLKNKIQISKPCQQRMGQILLLIANCQNNILIKETVFEDKSISKDKVVIVYREEGGEDWRPWKTKYNKAKQQANELSNQIISQKAKITQLFNSNNHEKDQLIQRITNQLKTIKNQLADSLQTIQTLNKEKTILINQKLETQMLREQISKLKFQMTQTQILEQNIAKQRYNIELERLKYKETIQKLQEKLLYNAFELQTIQMLKNKVSQSEKIIYEKEISINNLQNDILIMKANQTQINSLKEVCESEIFLLKQKILQISNNPESKTIIIQNKIQQHPAYIQLQDNFNQLDQSLRRAEEYISHSETFKLQQYQQISKYKHKYQSLVKQKQSLIRQIELNIKNEIKSQNSDFEQYFRYKVDPRYKQVLTKLFDLKKSYNKQTNATKQFLMKYESEHSESQQQIMTLIKSTFQELKEFDQTVILQKSKLKTFNINKFNKVMQNIRIMKKDNIQLKQQIASELKSEYLITYDQIIKKINQS